MSQQQGPPELSQSQLLTSLRCREHSPLLQLLLSLVRGSVSQPSRALTSPLWHPCPKEAPFCYGIQAPEVLRLQCLSSPTPEALSPHVFQHPDFPGCGGGCRAAAASPRGRAEQREHPGA